MRPGSMRWDGSIRRVFLSRTASAPSGLVLLRARTRLTAARPRRLPISTGGGWAGGRRISFSPKSSQIPTPETEARNGVSSWGHLCQSDCSCRSLSGDWNLCQALAEKGPTHMIGELWLLGPARARHTSPQSDRGTPQRAARYFGRGTSAGPEPMAVEDIHDYGCYSLGGKGRPGWSRVQESPKA